MSGAGEFPSWFWDRPAVVVRMVPDFDTQKSRRERSLPEIPIRYAGLRHLPRIADHIDIGNERWYITGVSQPGIWADDLDTATLGVPTVVGTVSMDGPVSGAGMAWP